MRLGYAVLAEMEDRSRQHRAGMAFADTVDQMVEITHAAAGHHRHIDRICNRAGEGYVITVARAVAVHAGNEQFAST